MPGSASLPRVALVYDVLYPWVRGGAEKRLWEIARRLPRFGFAPHLIGPRYWDGPRSIQREGVWLHGICPPRPLFTAAGTRSITGALAYAGDLLPALLRLRVDLIDCCAFPFFPWYSARAVAALRGAPLLTTWPEVWGPYWASYLGSPLKGALARAVELGVVQLSGHHLCPSPFTAARLEALSWRRRPITPLPAGIDAAALARYAAPLEQRRGIIFVGRLVAHKRVADLLQALARVRCTHPDAHLTIVGHGPAEPALRELVVSLGLRDHVTFLANLDEDALYTALGAARCLVLPSEREGQGMVVAEAQATGTPPIVARGPETAADFVHQDIDGLIYPVGDVPALTGALVALLGDDLLRRRLANGACQAARGLDWDAAILPRIADLYGSLLRRAGNGKSWYAPSPHDLSHADDTPQVPDLGARASRPPRVLHSHPAALPLSVHPLAGPSHAGQNDDDINPMLGYDEQTSAGHYEAGRDG